MHAKLLHDNIVATRVDLTEAAFHLQEKRHLKNFIGYRLTKDTYTKTGAAYLLTHMEDITISTDFGIGVVKDEKFYRNSCHIEKDKWPHDFAKSLVDKALEFQSEDIKAKLKEMVLLTDLPQQKKLLENKEVALTQAAATERLKSTHKTFLSNQKTRILELKQEIEDHKKPLNQEKEQNEEGTLIKLLEEELQKAERDVQEMKDDKLPSVEAYAKITKNRVEQLHEEVLKKLQKEQEETPVEPLSEYAQMLLSKKPVIGQDSVAIEHQIFGAFCVVKTFSLEEANIIIRSLESQMTSYEQSIFDGAYQLGDFEYTTAPENCQGDKKFETAKDLIIYAIENERKEGRPSYIRRQRTS
eukprot:Platyproteum_vivax@DN6960_c0_g1_i7.p1